MLTSTHSSWLLRPLVLTALLGLLPNNTWASVIYEFREVGSSSVISTIEIGPPATASGGWSVSRKNIRSVLFDDQFGFGSENLLPANLLPALTRRFGSAESLTGASLDEGGLEVYLPDDLIPSATREVGGLYVGSFFTPTPHTDSILLGTFLHDFDFTFIEVGRIIHGDWTVGATLPEPVPEPGTLVLFGLGLIAAVRTMRRKARLMK